MICSYFFEQFNHQTFRCDKESQWNEQDPRESMEAFIQLLSGYSSFCSRCMEGSFMILLVVFIESILRDQTRMRARLHFYTEQHVFDLPPLVNTKEKKKLLLRWNHFSSKIILTELIIKSIILYFINLFSTIQKRKCRFHERLRTGRISTEHFWRLLRNDQN